VRKRGSGLREKKKCGGGGGRRSHLPRSGARIARGVGGGKTAENDANRGEEKKERGDDRPTYFTFPENEKEGFGRSKKEKEERRRLSPAPATKKSGTAVPLKTLDG